MLGVGVVSADRLFRFMSEPKWSASQRDTAELTMESLERGLEGALFGTYITPRPFTETARIIAATGMVDTSYPVDQVTALDGSALGEGDPLPAGYELREHRLFRPAAAMVGGSDFLTTGFAGLYAPTPARPAGAVWAGSVSLSYMAGWGAEPALVLALLKKGATIMANRHSDTVTVRGLNAQAGASRSVAATRSHPEDWSEEELKPLGVYRRLGAGGR